MLVKNQKCYVCGANKVTKSKSMYVYCDYCGSWMGYDMQAAWQESMNVWTNNSDNAELKKQYNDLCIKLAEVKKDRNKEIFIDTQIQIHKLEFDIYPERFGPKGKQKAFREKYLQFYSEMYNETINEDYFIRLEKYSLIDSSKLKYTVENGRLKYDINDDFFKFFEENLNIIKEGFEDWDSFESVKNHPEGEVVLNKDFMFKNSVYLMLQIYNNNEVEALVKHFGLENSYVEIPDVTLTEISCKTCNTKLNVPENSDSVVCENCGCVNLVQTGMLRCLNCSASYNPVESKACPYCGSMPDIPKGAGEILESKYKEAANNNMQSVISNPNNEKTKGKKSFWSKLFGN